MWLLSRRRGCPLWLWFRAGLRARLSTRFVCGCEHMFSVICLLRIYVYMCTVYQMCRSDHIQCVWAHSSHTDKILTLNRQSVWGSPPLLASSSATLYLTKLLYDEREKEGESEGSEKARKRENDEKKGGVRKAEGWGEKEEISWIQWQTNQKKEKMEGGRECKSTGRLLTSTQEQLHSKADEIYDDVIEILLHNKREEKREEGEGEEEGEGSSHINGGDMSTESTCSTWE